MQLPTRDRSMTELVLHFLVIIYSFGLSGFVQVILQAVDLGKPLSHDPVFHHNVRV